MSNNYYLLLAGGVGAAKFIEGFAKIVPPEKIKIIVNTGDDIDLFGLKICPDLDIITYTLANVADTTKGWGFIDETFNCLSILKKYYDSGWFNLGDKDLATHIYRTDLFNRGFTKTEIMAKICEKLGVKTQVIPMCNEWVETYIYTPFGKIHFEEYYIKYRCEPQILKVEYKGIENAQPIEDVFTFINEAKKIIICPSNPIVSIGTILQVARIKDELINVKNKVFAISPIIEGAAVKGPADKLMSTLGLEVSCLGVAHFYKDFLGHFIIDNKDSNMKSQIEELGIKVHCFNTIMINLKKKVELAQFVLDL